MSKITKIWLIIATFLIVIGLSIFAAVMSANNWDFNKLGTVKYQTNTYQISEKFNDISIKTDTADILFVKADDGECKVVCYEQENVKHSVAIGDGVLKIDAIDTRKWYDYIGINIGMPKITVYLGDNEYASLFIKESTGDIEIPKDFSFKNIDISASTGDIKAYSGASGDIKIKTSTGNIQLENISANMIDLSVSTGKTKLADINCNNIASKGNTGDIILSNVIAKVKISIDRSTGDVDLEKCDANELEINTDTGDVKGSLLTDKVFVTQTDTGRVNVPKTTVGGRCEISTDTGNIDIGVQ